MEIEEEVSLEGQPEYTIDEAKKNEEICAEADSLVKKVQEISVQEIEGISERIVSRTRETLSTFAEMLDSFGGSCSYSFEDYARSSLGSFIPGPVVDKVGTYTYEEAVAEVFDLRHSMIEIMTDPQLEALLEILEEEFGLDVNAQPIEVTPEMLETYVGLEEYVPRSEDDVRLEVIISDDQFEVEGSPGTRFRPVIVRRVGEEEIRKHFSISCVIEKPTTASP